MPQKLEERSPLVGQDILCHLFVMEPEKQDTEKYFWYFDYFEALI